MNDTDLEQHLRALRPATPAPALEQRIAGELASIAKASASPSTVAPTAGVVRRADAGGRAARWLRDLGWAGAGALAALAMLSPETPYVASMQQGPARPVGVASAQAPADAFEHAAATEELLATEDAPELIETAEGLVRPVRYSYRERHAWANPLTGARMEIEVPREEVYLIPVALQ